MMYSLTWLPEVLEAAGLKVAETPGWRARGRGDMPNPRGVMCHHTATTAGGNMPTLNMLINGRPDLGGPLCQLGLGRDGTFYVVAAGRANHAGKGDWRGIVTGNSSFIGIEAENSGLAGDVWPQVQLDAYHRGVAAILKKLGAGAAMCCGHKEYALPAGRKPDPSLDMGAFRAAVAEFIAGKTPPPPIPAEDTEKRPTLRRGARGDWVRMLQGLIEVSVDGDFGAGTEAKVRAEQREHGLVGDGIVGPKTWAALEAPPVPPSPAPAAAAAPRPARETLSPSPACEAFIKGFEACRLTAYMPTAHDVPTIGWGSTGPDIRLGLTWTQEACDARFARDLGQFAAGVSRALAGAATRQAQFDAMVSLAYNIGIANFASSTLLRLHRAGDHAGAAAQFPRWNKQKGKVLAGLTRRREGERQMYLSETA